MFPTTCKYILDTYKKSKKIRDTHLPQNNFNIMVRENFEMIALMDNDSDVKIYFSNPPIEEQYEVSNKIEIFDKLEKVIKYIYDNPYNRGIEIVNSKQVYSWYDILQKLKSENI